MYKNIIDVLNQAIKHHQEIWEKSTDITEQEKHYFIQGLEVAKQLVEGEQDLVIDELAYETFEEVVEVLKGSLEKHEMEEIIEEVFDEED